MKVVVVHDYATQRGGAERVTLDLLRAFPDSRLVTSCWNPRGTYPDFANHRVETLWTDRLGVLRDDPRRALPFLAKAFSSHVVRDADVVVCSSSGWSHRVRTSVPKIVYCHNPARWLYQPVDYFANVAPWVRNKFVASTERLRESDKAAAVGAARYVVNSGAVAARVRSAYGLDSTIIPPARGISPEGPMERIVGVEPGYLLTVSRPRGYKHTDVICRAVASLAGQRLVVVGGADTTSWPLGVTALSNLTDAQLRWVYANAAGLIAVSYEDFGLTPVEAQAFGVPAVVLRSGGYLDSSIEGVTSVFVDEPSASSVADGIRLMLGRQWNSDKIQKHGERFSPESFTRRMNDVVNEVLGVTVESELPKVRHLPAHRIA